MTSTALKHADVIVVGAGSLGCNAAWHLHRLGRRVLVVDASSGPANESTRAAAGFVGCLAGVHNPRWGTDQAEIGKYGIEFYAQLARRCGRDIGFRQVGIASIF